MGKKRGTLNESRGKGKEKPKNQQDKELGRVVVWPWRDICFFGGKIRFVAKFHPTVAHKKIISWLIFSMFALVILYVVLLLVMCTCIWYF